MHAKGWGSLTDEDPRHVYHTLEDIENILEDMKWLSFEHIQIFPFCHSGIPPHISSPNMRHLNQPVFVLKMFTKKKKETLFNIENIFSRLEYATSEHIWLNILGCQANHLPEIMKGQKEWLTCVVKIAYVHSFRPDGGV
jgi:hypothetical protein